MIQTRPYVVPRLRLAYIAVEEYVRTFWFFVVAIPLGGIALLFFGDRVIQAIGYLAIFWPFTIPARAILISTKASRLFSTGAVMRAGDDEIEFLGTTPGAKGKPMRMAISRNIVRDVVQRQGMILVRTYRLTFAPIESAAFPNEEAKAEFVASFTRSADGEDDTP